MLSKALLFIEKNLGKDFLESLTKAELWKPGTKSVVDPQEIFIALEIVPRAVLSLLIRELAPMEIGETKNINLWDNSIVKTTKHERDVYSGVIEQDNKVLVDFKYRSIPGLGLVIMSAFELYDVDQLEDSKNQDQEAAEKVQKMIEERMAIHDMVHKVVDQKLMMRDAIQQMFMMKLTDVFQNVSVTPEPIVPVLPAPIEPSPLEAISIAKSINRKGSPLGKFLEERKSKIKKSEFTIELAKNETVNCPDCGKKIFDGKAFSGCICLGDDRDKKVFFGKSENGGVKVRFGRGWDPENIEMLLEVLRRQNG